MNDNKRKNNTDDDFWNIDYMMPPKHSLASFSKDTDTAEIVIEPIKKSETHNTDSSYNERRESIARSNIPLRHASELLKTTALNSFSYSPDNKLIDKITVQDWDSKYTFYRKFRIDAKQYFDKEGICCAYVPIYLTIPQYSLMKPEQLRYYFWWRSNVRKGVYIDSAYGYLLTYIYEIINLPELIKPQDGLNMLTDIWLAYRDKFWKLDTYLSEWVCDYCCIHKLSPPLEKLKPILGVIYTFASFKEFYAQYSTDSDESYWTALLDIGSDCNWRKSKFYTPETADLFEKHMKGAFLYTAGRLSLTDKNLVNNADNALKSTLVRRSYPEALCVYDIKRKITIEYTAISRSPALRSKVEAIIKICENNIRAMLGKKSRYQIPIEFDYLKKIVDEYFAPVKASMRKKAKDTIPEPDYMKLYEAASTGFTVENAADIEKSSLDITELLVDAFDEDNEEQAAEDSVEDNKCGDKIADTDQNTENQPSNDVSLFDRAMLCLLKDDRIGFEALAGNANMLTDSLCEGINEAMYDIIGDICIEDCRLIDDYIEDIKNYLSEKGVLNE